MKIRVYFGMKTFLFFFWFSPQLTKKFAQFWDETRIRGHLRMFWDKDLFFFLSLPQISSSFAMNIFFLVHTLEFKEMKFSCPPKFMYAPPPPSHAILAPGLAFFKLSTIVKRKTINLWYFQLHLFMTWCKNLLSSLQRASLKVFKHLL